MAGAATIRAFNCVPYFVDASDTALLTAARVRLVRSATFCWLSIRLSVLATCVSAAAVTLIIVGNVPAALAGAALTVLLQLADTLASGVRATAAAESSLTSVERIKQYLDVRLSLLSLTQPALPI